MWENVYPILVSEKAYCPILKNNACSQSKKTEKIQHTKVLTVFLWFMELFYSYFSVVSNISTKNVYYSCNNGKW